MVSLKQYFRSETIENTSANEQSSEDYEVSSISFEEEGNNAFTPLEKNNPLGYSVGPLSVVVLILQGVVGTGIFTTPGSILNSMGSIGSTYVLWLTCFFFPIANIFVYIEFAGYFPKRNGGEVAYLEQAYPKPKFLVPTIYAAVSVVLSYTTGSALAFGQYILNAANIEATTWNYRGIAIAALSASCISVAISTRWSLRLQNLLGFVKVVFMLFIVVLGWVVLAGGTKVTNPNQSFQDVWAGTTTSGNDIANSIIKVSFSYSGYNYAFGVVAEHSRDKNLTEGQNRKKLMRTYSLFVPISMFAIYIIYILMITAYYASASPEQIKVSGISIATLMFQNVFENESATSALSVMVALSSFGHLVTAVLSHSRGLRECGRQGVLPFPKFWTSIKPIGTPLGPIFITWLVNLIMIIGPPAGSAYNFIVDMGAYCEYVFALFLIIGLLKTRRDHRLKGLGTKGHYLPLPLLIILLLFELMVIAIAFVPPEGTLIGDSDIFYATYPIVTIGILLGCVGYYFIWRYTLPKLGKYVHREVIFRLENGEFGNTIVKVKLEDLEEWDKEHKVDVNGVSFDVMKYSTKSSETGSAL